MMTTAPNEIIQPVGERAMVLRVRICPVCGRKIGRDFAIPTSQPRKAFVRSNETCELCWAWSIRFDS